MADIRKNLTLSAKLDDSQLRKQFDILKKEMGKAFSVDAGSLNDLKASIKDIAKEFGAQLRKELEGVRSQKGRMAQSVSKGAIDMSDIGSMQVREMQVTNMIVNSMTLKGAAAASGGGGGFGGSSAAGDKGGGSLSDFINNNKNSIRVAGVGLGIQRGVNSYINTQQIIAERNNRMSRDFESGLGVEGIARQAGRNNKTLAYTAAAGGAIAGGAAGAKIGGGVGAFFGGIGAPIGAGLGGLVGGIGGGVASYFGASNAAGEMSKEQVQLLADAEARARAISPMRQQMLAGGGISRGTLTDQMKTGARGFGMSAEETLQNMLEARESLGNKGAADSFSQIMGNKRFLGIGAGTSAQNIETLAGAGGESRASSANRQSDIIKKGVASGLDVSKSGRYLQTVTQFLQNTTGFGRVDTGLATDRLAGLASGFGGGNVTETSLNQAQGLAQLLHGESSSIQGISGAANLNQIQKLGGQFGGFGTGTSLALAGLSSGAGENDILSILTEGQKNGEVGKNVDLAQAVKSIQSAKNQDATMNLMSSLAGGNNNLAIGALGAEQNFQGNYTTESLLGRQRATAGAITPGAMTSAQEAIQGAKAGVTEAPEFQLDVAQFTRSTESAAAGLTTFTEVTTQMTNQMKKLMTDLEAAQKRFADQSRQTGYGGISR